MLAGTLPLWLLWVWTRPRGQGAGEQGAGSLRLYLDSFSACRYWEGGVGCATDKWKERLGSIRNVILWPGNGLQCDSGSRQSWKIPTPSFSLGESKGNSVCSCLVPCFSVPGLTHVLEWNLEEAFLRKNCPATWGYLCHPSRSDSRTVSSRSFPCLHLPVLHPAVRRELW